MAEHKFIITLNWVVCLMTNIWSKCNVVYWCNNSIEVSTIEYVWLDWITSSKDEEAKTLTIWSLPIAKMIMRKVRQKTCGVYTFPSTVCDRYVCGVRDCTRRNVSLNHSRVHKGTRNTELQKKNWR